MFKRIFAVALFCWIAYPTNSYAAVGDAIEGDEYAKALVQVAIAKEKAKTSEANSVKSPQVQYNLLNYSFSEGTECSGPFCPQASRRRFSRP